MKKCLYLFFILLFISCKPKINKETIVGIQPYKGLSKVTADTIAMTIADFYEVKTIILPEIKLPKVAFTNYKAPRYRADSLIQIQKRNLSKTTVYILGLTDKDICITKYEKNGLVKKPVNKYTDFGIKGLAYCHGNSCIVSSFRLKNTDTKTHFLRLKKVAVHEFGHNLGLSHCPNKKCVMTDAVESIATIDNANLELCVSCKSKI